MSRWATMAGVLLFVAASGLAAADEIHFRNGEVLDQVRILEEWADRLIVDPSPMANDLDQRIQAMIDRYRADHGQAPPTLVDPSPALGAALELAVANYRSSTGEYPASLGDLPNLPPIPPFVQVSYDPLTGRVDVRSTIPDLPPMPDVPPYLRVSYDPVQGTVDIVPTLSTVPKAGIEYVVLGDGDLRQEFNLPSETLSGLQVFPGLPTSPGMALPPVGPVVPNLPITPVTPGMPAAPQAAPPLLPPPDITIPDLLPAQPGQAALQVVSGTAWRRRTGTSDETAAATGQTMWRSGDVVRTDAASQALVVLGDGTSILLAETTEILLSATPLGNARVTLLAGKVAIAKDGYFVVEGGGAVLTTDGGTFAVGLDPTGLQAASGHGNAVIDAGDLRAFLASGQAIRLSIEAEGLRVAGSASNRLALVVLPMPGLRLEIAGGASLAVESAADGSAVTLWLPRGSSLLRPANVTLAVYASDAYSEARFGLGEGVPHVPIPAGQAVRVRATEDGFATLTGGDTAWVALPESP